MRDGLYAGVGVILATIAGLTAGCVGTVQPGPINPDVNPINVKTEVIVDGTATLTSIRVESPLGESVYTYPVRVWGNGTAFIQAPRKPYIRFEGDGGWEILPINPSHAAWLAESVRRGEIVATTGVLSIRREP